eukprot:14836327-Alexandrium_andersonii.AAC.1
MAYAAWITHQDLSMARCPSFLRVPRDDVSWAAPSVAAAWAKCPAAAGTPSATPGKRLAKE